MTRYFSHWRMKEASDGEYVKAEDVKKVLKSALLYLEGSHVQANAHRLGAIGAQDIASAISTLRTTLTPLEYAQQETTNPTEA